ncbi:MAG: tubulin-like doman-containing protein, partial [Gemmataceae bacterium]
MELLTGHRPFNGKNARMLAQQHMNEAPDLRALPEGERPVVARALEKDPTKRFPNCLSFVRALYAARNPSLASLLLQAEKSGRPKTIVDTLENIQLEALGELDQPHPDQLEPVELPHEVVRLGEDNEAISNLGVTVARPTSGSLRPTLILGVGGYGRRALMELRCRLIDRFGDLDKLPLFRFLYLDSDNDALKAAQRGSAEVALRNHEVYHLPLQQVSHYRRRQLDQLMEWLPREKLYAMPRSLKTQGSRALGRLAFADNYVRLVARLKREIQQACDPDGVYASVSATGLALRDMVPRVYVLAGAAGGASGYLVDLGYALRRLLKQMNQPDASVVQFLFCGAPEDPATPESEQANIYATLTELNHFSEPAITFSAQYGTDGPRLVDEEAPYDVTYLLPQEHRTAEARRDVLSHMGSYLFHELTTPLGVRLDQSRNRRTATHFRSLGTFGVWFPRGLLLRMAARSACSRLIEDWQASPTELTASEQAVLQASLTRVLGDPDWQPSVLAERIAQLAGEIMETPLRDALTKMLMTVEEQSLSPMASDDPGGWAKQALQKVRDWLGGGVAIPGVATMQHKRSPLTRALERAAANLAKLWDERLGQVINGLMDHGGRRLALAETALGRLKQFCEEAMEKHAAHLQKEASKFTAVQQQVDQALADCFDGGGWSLFGGRTRRNLRVFLDHLGAFARHAVQEDTNTVVLQFYAALQGRLSDRLRDLGFCRQRLRHLQQMLEQSHDSDEDIDNVVDTMTFTRTPGGASWPSGVSVTPSLQSAESYWESIRESATNRVVLPEGEKSLESAAKHFLASLSAEHWIQLDHRIGDELLGSRGGLLKMCLDSADLNRFFATPLINLAIETLTQHLPMTDVAQAEYSHSEGIKGRLQSYFGAAKPLVLPESPNAAVATRNSGVRQVVHVGGESPVRSPKPVKSDPQLSLLLVPASEAGKRFSELAKEIYPDITLVNVPGQADLMFCREQIQLRLEDLEPLLRTGRNAYHEACLTPQNSPHSRFDLVDWSPLDP